MAPAPQADLTHIALPEGQSTVEIPNSKGHSTQPPLETHFRSPGCPAQVPLPVLRLVTSCHGDSVLGFAWLRAPSFWCLLGAEAV